MPSPHDPETGSRKKVFEELGQEKNLSLAQEFRLFITESKKWWLIPILLVCALMGLLIVLGSTGAAPFLYTLF